MAQASYFITLCYDEDAKMLLALMACIRCMPHCRSTLMDLYNTLYLMSAASFCSFLPVVSLFIIIFNFIGSGFIGMVCRYYDEHELASTKYF